jgi:quinol monooxygenase YgiN
MTFGLVGKFTAHPGRGEELVQILLEAATLLQANPACLQYVVSTSDEPDAVWISEVWTGRAAHEASLEPEETRALIARALPLIAGMSERTELMVRGGKGVA